MTLNKVLNQYNPEVLYADLKHRARYGGWIDGVRPAWVKTVSKYRAFKEAEIWEYLADYYKRKWKHD